MQCTFFQYGLYQNDKFSVDGLRKYGRHLLEKKYKQYIPVYYEAVDKCLELTEKTITNDGPNNSRQCQIKPAFMSECIKSEMIWVRRTSIIDYNALIYVLKIFF